MTKKEKIKPEKPYTDCNGDIINYGDILRIKSLEIRKKSKYAPKTPFAMLINYKKQEDMIYISGMDDFITVDDCKFTDFEIFAKREIYENTLNRFKRSLNND